LESYSKSKKEHYEQRCQAVKDATKKHKHLLLFTKISSTTTPQASPREQEDVSTLLKFNNFLPKNPTSLSFRGGATATEEDAPLSTLKLNYPQPNLLMKKLKKDFSAFHDDNDMLHSWDSRGESYREKKPLPLSVWTEATASRASTPNRKKEGRKDDLKQIVAHLESKFHHCKSTQNSPRFLLSHVVSPKDRIGGLKSAGIQSEKFFFPKDFSTDHNRDTPATATATATADKKFGRSKIRSVMHSQTDHQFFTQPGESERFHTRASEIVSSISVKIEKSESARFSILQSPQWPKILSSRLSPRQQVKYLVSNESNFDTLKGDSKAHFEQPAITLFSKSISETISPRTERLKSREMFERSQKGFNHVNWEQQRQKIKNIIEEKAGKEYRKYFYSIDGDIRAALKSRGDQNLALDQLKSENDKEIISKKNPKSGVLKTVKYEPKIDTAIKKFDVNGKSLV